jgi:hypothetical protein
MIINYSILSVAAVSVIILRFRFHYSDLLFLMNIANNVQIVSVVKKIFVFYVK